MPRYERASDDVLRANGFDPSWVDSIDDPDIEREGPYAVYMDHKGNCPCCYGEMKGYSVIDLIEACEVGGPWYGDDAKCEAEETVNLMNRVWVSGHDAGNAAPRMPKGFGPRDQT